MHTTRAFVEYCSPPPICGLNNIQDNLHRVRRILFPAIFLSCFISSQALAENCEGLASNPEWTQNLAKIQEDYKAGNYGAVVETAKPMFQICSISPALLYYTGSAIEKQGDAERALIYYTKASENLTVMAADANMSRQIWYKRYELEHPDRTEEAVAAQSAKVVGLEQKVSDLESQALINSTNTSLDESKKHEITLWTGVGMGGLGIILIGTGAGVAASVEKSGLVEPDGNKLRINEGFTAGWALIGTGIGLTVAGAVMAGIGGYHYSKAKADAVMTFNASPVSASFAMTF